MEKLIPALVALITAITELVNAQAPAGTPAKAVKAATVTPVAAASDDAGLLGDETPAPAPKVAAKPAAKPVAKPAAKPAAPAAAPVSGSIEEAIAGIDKSIVGLARAREIAKIKRAFAAAAPAAPVAEAAAEEAAPAAEETVAEEAPAPAPKPAGKAATTNPAVKPTGKPATSAKPAAKPAAAPAGDAPTIKSVRELGLKLLKKNKEGAKLLTGVLNEVGAANLAALPEDKLQVVTDKLNALLAA